MKLCPNYAQFPRLQVAVEGFVNGRQIATQTSDLRIWLLIVAAEPELSLATQRYQMVEAMNAHLNDRPTSHQLSLNVYDTTVGVRNRLQTS